jgi:dsDNA-specific endonuclease/ATPase MutS2
MTDDPVDDDDDFVPEEIVLPIEDWIDLHPFRPGEVRSVVESYLEAALAEGFTEVRLVHGRGIGVQREIVRKLLSKHAAVADFGDAPPGRGGWGATVVRFSCKSDEKSNRGGGD